MQYYLFVALRSDFHRFPAQTPLTGAALQGWNVCTSHQLKIELIPTYQIVQLHIKGLDIFAVILVLRQTWPEETVGAQIL